MAVAVENAIEVGALEIRRYRLIRRNNGRGKIDISQVDIAYQ